MIWIILYLIHPRLDFFFRYLVDKSWKSLPVTEVRSKWVGTKALGHYENYIHKSWQRENFERAERTVLKINLAYFLMKIKKSWSYHQAMSFIEGGVLNGRV